MQDFTRAQLCTAVIIAGAAFVGLWLELALVFWLVRAFGLEVGVLLFMGSLVGTAVTIVGAMLLWNHWHPSVSASPPAL